AKIPTAGGIGSRRIPRDFQRFTGFSGNIWIMLKKTGSRTRKRSWIRGFAQFHNNFSLFRNACTDYWSIMVLPPSSTAWQGGGSYQVDGRALRRSENVKG